MVSSSLIPTVKARTYLTDGDRLYFVIKVRHDTVVLENCTTLTKHVRDLDIVLGWREVSLN